jgi:hypothetical protein
MTVSAALEPSRPSEEAAARQGERRALGVACGAHVLHDGYTDLVWVALPIWQAEFGLSYTAVAPPNQRDELASFELIGLHSRQPSHCRISNWRGIR